MRRFFFLAMLVVVSGCCTRAGTAKVSSANFDAVNLIIDLIDRVNIGDRKESVISALGLTDAMYVGGAGDSWRESAIYLIGDERLIVRYSCKSGNDANGWLLESLVLASAYKDANGTASFPIKQH